MQIIKICPEILVAIDKYRPDKRRIAGFGRRMAGTVYAGIAKGLPAAPPVVDDIGDDVPVAVLVFFPASRDADRLARRVGHTGNRSGKVFPKLVTYKITFQPCLDIP